MIEEKTAAWKTMQVSGIFFDEAGYDYGNDRARQNAAIHAAHARGLRVFINAWKPQDLFDSTSSGSVPLIALKSGDAHLYESFGVMLGKAEAVTAQQVKLSSLAAARQRGIRIFGVTTSHQAGLFDKALWTKTITAALEGHLTGLGWGELHFSAADNRLPWRW
jgi:hypothetical protein